MHLLTYSVTLFGISAPWFSWAAAVVLVVWPSWEILKLRSLSRRQESISNNLLNDIEEIRKQFPVQGNKGLAAIAIDRLHKIFLDIPSLIGAWNIYRKNLIYRSSSSDNDDEQVWATESALNVLPEDLLLGSNFNKRHFNSIPGIVTGIGLLMTFLAILVALLHVSINADNKVIGLQNLIGGLSGKFISSVAAVEEFGEYVTGYNQINHDLRNASQEINATMSALSESSQKLKEGQESFNKIAEFAKVQIQQLSASQEQQQDLWKGINSSMERYSKTFHNVESSAANILSQISQNLQEFSRVTQEHFNKTVTVANEHVNLAVGKLNTSIEELSEKLDDLTGTVSEIDKISNRFKR